jgi:hypothetical protein
MVRLQAVRTIEDMTAETQRPGGGGMGLPLRPGLLIQIIGAPSPSQPNMIEVNPIPAEAQNDG